jgi:hypothetical protein
VRIADDGSIAVDTAYRLIAAQRTFRVNSDGSTSPVVNVTAQSQKYGVQYTWTILGQTWDQDGGPPAIALKTEQVNAICGHDHVLDFRTEQDQGASGQLFNYAVITVGTDDELVTDEARVRMDHIGEPAAFAAIDTVWRRIAAALG